MENFLVQISDVCGAQIFFKKCDSVAENIFLNFFVALFNFICLCKILKDEYVYGRDAAEINFEF